MTISGSAQLNFKSGKIEGTAGNKFAIITEDVSATNPVFAPNNLYLETGLGSAGANLLSLITSGAERIRIMDNGWTGIGTTTPYSVLSVSTSTQSAPATKLLTVASTTGQTLLTVLGSGKVGVGTSTPSALLSIEATAGNDLFTIGSSTKSYLRVNKNGKLILDPGSGFGSTAPTLAFGDGDTGIILRASNALGFVVGGSTLWQAGSLFGGVGDTKPALYNQNAGVATPNILPMVLDTDTGIGGSYGDILTVGAGGGGKMRVTGA